MSVVDQAHVKTVNEPVSVVAIAVVVGSGARMDKIHLLMEVLSCPQLWMRLKTYTIIQDCKQLLDQHNN